MKRVDQTTFGSPGGNCFSACLATLLEVPLAEVPYFMDAGDAWLEQVQAWLRPRGLYAVPVVAGDDWTPAGLCIISGTTERSRKPEDLHSVVARGSEIIHDHHPSRAGLLTRKDVILLVPLDPANLPTAWRPVTPTEPTAGEAVLALLPRCFEPYIAWRVGRNWSAKCPDGAQALPQEPDAWRPLPQRWSP